MSQTASAKSILMFLFYSLSDPILFSRYPYLSSLQPANTPVFPPDVPHLSSDPVPGTLSLYHSRTANRKACYHASPSGLGASACFMDAEYARQHQVEAIPRHHPIKLEVINGRDIASGTVTHESIPIPTLVSLSSLYYS